MNGMPPPLNAKISVIVPIYKVEKYIEKCVDSIVNQTYRNLEIILVDDGSPDNCGRICDAYAALDDRIRVIHQKNGGLSDARNTGLNAATGEYVSFVDSDDYIHEQFFEVLLQLAIRNDADIAQCGFLRFEEGESIPKKKISIHNIAATVLSRDEALYNLHDLGTYLEAVVAWDKLYKKSLFIGIRYPKGKVHEDEFTTYKLLYKSSKVVTTSESLYFYLQRADGIMGNFNAERLEILQAYYEQIHFYKEKKLYEIEKKAKINFEGLIRNLMLKVLHSKLNDKNNLFKQLVAYYRQHYFLFSSNTGSKIQKKTIMLLFRYSNHSTIKMLTKLRYYKSLLN